MFGYNRNPANTITFNPTTSKYCVNFAGKTIETTVTDKGSTIDEWVQQWRSLEILSMYDGKPTVVGLDIEWRPHPIRSMSNKSATLQLCIDEKCLIIQLFYSDYIPESLKSFMMDSNFIFVGIEVDDDIAKLDNEYGLPSNKSADIRELAKAQWPGRFRRPGLKDLALEVSGLAMKKPKHVCMSNWEARVLNENQVEYACLDAYASYRVGHKLLFEL
ncbi:3'-5' exonuclease-like [Corylus avellana]|uniref:3'-5' exonuclease-like n=1 Tax=Corylus avellana TaxID=13451 RepID=UPI00286C3CF6|nr:3'-5' exonuclease-like [Corylus avellana]